MDNQGVVNIGIATTLGRAGSAHLNSGDINVVGGNLTLNQSGVNTSSFTNTGTVDIASGRTFTINGGAFTNAQGGTIQGSGTLNVSSAVFSNAGDISPGASPGRLSIVGNFPQTSTGAINVEIGGTVINQFDQLDITGQASLDGTLNITLIGGFEPNLNDSFTIMTFGSRSGMFTTVNGLDIGNRKRFEVFYNADDVTLLVVAAP